MDLEIAWNNIVTATRGYLGTAEQHHALEESLQVVSEIIMPKIKEQYEQKNP